jgi:hypothetical protein
MTNAMTMKPVWASLTIRMADGLTYEVELNDEIVAELKIWFDEVIDVDESARTGWVMRKVGDMHVDATIKGLGSKATRVAPVANADQKPPETEPTTKAIEQTG